MVCPVMRKNDLTGCVAYGLAPGAKCRLLLVNSRGGPRLLVVLILGALVLHSLFRLAVFPLHVVRRCQQLLFLLGQRGRPTAAVATVLPHLARSARLFLEFLHVAGRHSWGNADRWLAEVLFRRRYAHVPDRFSNNLTYRPQKRVPEFCCAGQIK